MEKKELTQFAKDYFGNGFDHGFHTAVDMIRALAPQMENERDTFVMENLAKVLSENAKREKWLFFAQVRFEVSDDGVIVLSWNR